MSQLFLPMSGDIRQKNERCFHVAKERLPLTSYPDKLSQLLSQDLDFCVNRENHGVHTLHSFPAKFPPELPRKFIQELTDPNEVVLDPMIGSGTTLVEAFLAGRLGIGFDIDPLALLMSQVKVAQFNKEMLQQIGNHILTQAAHKIWLKRAELTDGLQKRWDKETFAFIDYWFAPEIQMELFSLITEIERLSNPNIRSFFALIFSSIIITKSGGVSYALDLGHTRPHRAKIVRTGNGKILLDECSKDDSSRKIEILTKTVRSPIDEFGKRIKQHLDNLLEQPLQGNPPIIQYGNAQALPLGDASVDLIVTSPPYASNAIDYMRAHKFSLVWMGHSIQQLTQDRKQYIGGESATATAFEELPSQVAGIVKEVDLANKKKGKALFRYYSEMTRTLREMFRVLKPGKAAVVVVGNSILSGKDTQIQTCLAEIGKTLGFQVPKIGVRQLDRNKRMMPVGMHIDSTSTIQQRMHEEYIIGFYKPPI